MKKRILSAILTAALMLTLSSCGGSTSGSPSAAGAGDGIGAKNGGEYGGAVEGTYPVTSAAAAYDADYIAEEYEYAEDFSLSDGDRETSDSQRRAGLLTGGEWRDNTNFLFWKSIFDQREDWADEPDKWKLDVRDRIFVRVKDSSGSPACGMKVKLAEKNTIIWETVTDSRGEAFLFPNIDPLVRKYTPDKLIVEAADGRAVTQELDDKAVESVEPIEMTVPDPSPMRDKLDLMFMIDTTGSMDDELSYLQTELASVIDRVVDSKNVDVRLSVNFYRDEDDDYVVRDYGFTDRINIAIEHLEDQRAAGGGDYPEAVTDAIGNGLYKHEWRDDSEKLMILVLDAPPHLEDGITYMKSHIAKAAHTGVRIIPVASSGVDTDTEFLCRCMAIVTGGTYTFLTDDSGIGNSHLAPTVGDYEVEKLNDMLVRVIGDYFSQEPREYNTVLPPVPEQTDEDPQFIDPLIIIEQPSVGTAETTAEPVDDIVKVKQYPAEYRYTHDYFGDDGYYSTGVITSEETNAAFIEKYGFELVPDIDFFSQAVVYEVRMLSSGSITVDDEKGVYCTAEDGKPALHYELNIPEVGTADIKTLFVYAVIPSPLLMVSPE